MTKCCLLNSRFISLAAATIIPVVILCRKNILIWLKLRGKVFTYLKIVPIVFCGKNINGMFKFLCIFVKTIIFVSANRKLTLICGGIRTKFL